MKERNHENRSSATFLGQQYMVGEILFLSGLGFLDEFERSQGYSFGSYIYISVIVERSSCGETKYDPS